VAAHAELADLICVRGTSSTVAAIATSLLFILSPPHVWRVGRSCVAEDHPRNQHWCCEGLLSLLCRATLPVTFPLCQLRPHPSHTLIDSQKQAGSLSREYDYCDTGLSLQYSSFNSSCSVCFQPCVIFHNFDFAGNTSWLCLVSSCS
jgi:hypothetical protein